VAGSHTGLTPDLLFSDALRVLGTCPTFCSHAAQLRAPAYLHLLAAHACKWYQVEMVPGDRERDRPRTASPSRWITQVCVAVERALWECRIVHARMGPAPAPFVAFFFVAGGCRTRLTREHSPDPVCTQAVARTVLADAAIRGHAALAAQAAASPPLAAERWGTVGVEPAQRSVPARSRSGRLRNASPARLRLLSGALAAAVGPL